MYEPVRGGTRGGQAEFKWADVSADKDREHYLGHSINAPTGRWQKNKDVHWYNRELNQDEDERRAELRRIKEAEEEAMAQLLGFAPTKKTDEGSPTAGPASGQDGDSVPQGTQATTEEELQRKMEKRLRKMEKRERKTEKKARKEAKRSERLRSASPSGHRRREHNHERRNVDSASDGSGDERVRERHRLRSRSPRRRSSMERDIRHQSRRSASPLRFPRRPRSPSPPVAHRDDGKYGSAAMERNHSRDRRRWDDNAREELPRSHQYRR